MARSSKSKSDEAELENVNTPAGIEIRKPKVRKSEALWLMTFSDLSFVLMCFFVLMLTFSEPKKDKYDEVATKMAAKPPPEEPQPDNLASLEEKIQEIIKVKNLEKIATVKLTTDGLSVEFKDVALFRSGATRPKPTYKKLVGEVLDVIAKAPPRYKLIVEGHTDDVPMRGQRIRSNWELASARGVAMLDIFKRKGVSEKRMAIESFAHTRPVAKVGGLKGRQLTEARAQNRRVVIRLE